MFRLLRRMRRSDDGQSIVLAAVSMLILSLGVLMTINLGHAVQQRIQLQNAADASAYSLAAMEARAFNFFAFTNRAQVSHYNAMMTLTAYTAFFSKLEAMFGVASDNFYYIHTWLCWLCRVGCIPPPTTFGCWACPIKPIMSGLGNVARAAAQLFGGIVDATDQVFAGLVLGISKGNYLGMYTMQYIVGAALETHLLTSMRDVTRQNTEDVDFGLTDVVTATANIQEFQKTFDEAVGAPPSWASGWTPPTSNDATKEAKRVMAEVVNASRTPHNHLTYQKLPFTDAPIPLLGQLIGGQTKLIDQQKLAISGDLTGEYNGPGPGWGVKDIRAEGQDESKLNPGDVLASDSWFKFGVAIPGGGALGSMYSVYVVTSHDQNQRRHLRWVEHDFTEAACMYIYGLIQIAGFDLALNPFDDADDHHTHHNWDGLTPFMKFAPNADPDKDFHQPSTYVFLNKKPEDLERVFTKKFEYSTGAGDTQEVDFNVGKDGLLGTGQFQGLNALSRGLVYYHRPGNWQEHPNFFNPFWRAKLAPLAQDKELAGKLGAVPGIGGFLNDALLLH